MAPAAQKDAMPKGNADSSKKQRRKEAAAERARAEAALKQLVSAAAADADPLRHLAPPFRAFSRGGLSARIEAAAAAGLPAPLLEWALGLCRRNMAEMYEGVWGWSDKKKSRQLAHEDSRFLIAFDATAPGDSPSDQGSSGDSGGQGGGSSAAAAGGAGAGSSSGGGGELPGPNSSSGMEAGGLAAGSGQAAPLAYINYRFELEDGEPVAYCYEVQLEAAARRRGLGKHLMRLLELIALRSGMAAVMLTVMRSNGDALAFYGRLGYSEHESSPGFGGEEEPAGYVIMHKPLAPPNRPAAAAAAAAGATGAAGGGRQ